MVDDPFGHFAHRLAKIHGCLLDPAERLRLGQAEALLEQTLRLIDDLAGRKTLFEVLQDASHAAKEGVDYTKTIAARRGRASLVGERSIGHEDPGAVSSMLMYRALYNFLRK